MANGFDEDQELKKSAGVEKLNKYSNLIELQTICKIFPALTPEEALKGNDAFYTKNLLCNVEKINFENKFQKLKAKQKRK